jgi:hypothetical protein
MDDGLEFPWHRIIRPVAGDARRRTARVRGTAHPGPFEWPGDAGFTHRPAHFQCPGADCNGYGYINRALPADELTPFVEKLAHRIASFPAHAIAHAKAAVDAGAFSSMAEGLLVEAHESDLSVASEVTQARVREALKVGAETYEGELVIDFLSRLSDKVIRD